MLGHTHVFILWNIHPLCFVFKDLADGAPFHAISCGDVFLARIGVFLVVKTYRLAVNVEKTLLSLLSTWNDGAWGRRKGESGESLGVGG